MIHIYKKQTNRARGFTLLEVLIATAVTLLLMLGLAQVFKVLGDSITRGRAGLELNNRLRNVLHRIRTDLDNVTVTPRPPIHVGAGQGYLKYYDGPMWDGMFASDPLHNRFGDMDDILMATVKAEDSWFTGKVPRFVLEQRAPLVVDANGNGIIDELEDLVTISSQYAEVIVFAEPLPTQNAFASADPTSPNTNRDPIRLAVDPLGGFADVFPEPDAIPDGYRLHYRVLLIRPDLNMVTGALPGIGNANPANRVMVAGPEAIGAEFQVQQPPNPAPGGYLPIIPFNSSGNRVVLPSPECDMWRIHQFCDLSVRRVYSAADSLTGSQDYVAANSLEDLANPLNRFAHVIHVVPGLSSVTTMPVLALGPTIPSVQGTNPALAGSGFLHPAYMLLGTRSGEDVLSTDVLAFDIKGFDTSAPLVGYVGSDGQPGAAGVNDEGIGATDDFTELGWSGSDDIVLRPGDPGYALQLAHALGGLAISGTAIAPDSSQAAVVSLGEFVDLNWGGKASLTYSSPPPPGYPSVLSLGPHVKSGLNRATAAGTQIFQPSYDTFSDLFEQDGFFEAQIGGSGVVVASSATGNLEAWRTTVDAGRDGIDNGNPASIGADDPEELETLPPYPTDLRGLQISVRLEDRATKQFKQMSTIKEFVTH